MDDSRRLAIALNLELGNIQIQIMPLLHVGGMKNLWGYFFVGATSVIMPQIGEGVCKRSREIWIKQSERYAKPATPNVAS